MRACCRRRCVGKLARRTSSARIWRRLAVGLRWSDASAVALRQLSWPPARRGPSIASCAGEFPARHRTLFIAGPIDESRNDSQFVAIACSAARRTAVSANPHPDERTRRGAMPKSRRQGRGRHWHGSLSQHRPRQVRRLQVGNLVAQYLHRAGGREGRFFRPGLPLAWPDFPGNS